jgi:hypothetical protein
MRRGPELGAEQGGHVLEADPDAGEPAYAAAPSGDGVPPPEELVLRVNEMERQLQHASMVRANYEKQLHQLSSALQAERITKGERPAPRTLPVLQRGGSLWQSTCVCVCVCVRGAHAVCAAHVPTMLRWLQDCANCLRARACR